MCVQPIVAILHTLYGTYHLCRSPVTRPPGSQASYMVFAATLDLGLIPYYVFSAYIAYKQITNNAYHWSTLLSADASITDKIAHSTFILSIVNGSFHLISLCISVWLAIIFRQISQLPPDLNPLEDNLTARRHKRNKSEINEKHLSRSTIASATSMGDPLIGPPRHVPFMHTRNQSSEDASSRFSVINEKRRSQQSMYSDKVVPPLPDVPPVPQHSSSFLAEHDQQASAQSPLADPHQDHAPQVSRDLPDRTQCVSPDSDNWIVYPSRSPSPAQASLNENLARREPSSAYSQTESIISAGSSFKDWLTSAQRYERYVNGTISEDVRGEYESLALHEHYANDEDSHDDPQVARFYDNAEQDIGDHNIDVFVDHNDRERQFSASLQVNPLALNPPTPKPVQEETNNAPQPRTRAALTEIPNLTPNPPASPPSPDSPEKKGRFYGELDTKAWFTVPRSTSGQKDSDSPRKLSNLFKRNSQKLSTYGSLKQDDADDSDDENEAPAVPTDPVVADSDRKGRVVSNSGVDIGRHDFGSGSSLAYGNYIANLGVGRRRDVSGKVAEEGRGGVVTESPRPIRAAGWARFAGL